METSEILKKVRRIEIKTRGLSNNIFAGQYHSAFKGRGMAFSEVREYQFGDGRCFRQFGIWHCKTAEEGYGDRNCGHSCIFCYPEQ